MQIFNFLLVAAKRKRPPVKQTVKNKK